ncbi:hypothetical protein CC117_25300 [Parafrankia colletiae]|uniref:Uncharacterized protein n=1 Tax=Parafrankia colletiae TaxID=573497 RepID=A0A1S1QFX8_9ACTN|nr:hypothetical protein [Parafrankia colletiae]OHV32135.1 hypothetical protein CC117_25300 [Parafrankia colletiae]
MSLEDRSTQTGAFRPDTEAAETTRPISATKPADSTRRAGSTRPADAAKSADATPDHLGRTVDGTSSAALAPEHPAARDGDAERAVEGHPQPAVTATDAKPPVIEAPAAQTPTAGSTAGPSTGGPSGAGTGPAVDPAVAGADPAGPGESARLRERWQEALLSFVDDPRGAVRQADQVLDEAVNQLTEAVRREQDRLRAAWREDGAPSTDTLRDALRGYRDFLERLVTTPR